MTGFSPAHLMIAGVLAGLFATAPAWSQTGTVESYKKISDTQGNFTASFSDADEFGGAVAHLGDLDGAGPSVAALAVGAIGDDDGGTDRGCLYVLFLNSAGTVLSYQKISDTQGNFTATIDNADEFGGSLAYLGDLDGAGPSVAAIAVGAPGDDDGGINHGAVYVLFLNSAGSVLSYQKISDTQGNFTATLDTADEVGGTVISLGDLDGPGPSVRALAVGAIGDDDGGTDRGCVYVLFLNGAGRVLSYQKISDTQGNFTAPLVDADEFGSAVAHLGDLDDRGPSVAALAVGAIGDDDGGSGRGAVYVLFLDSAGSVLAYQKISDTQGNFTATLDNSDEFGGALSPLGDLDGAGSSVAALAVAAAGDDDGGTDRGCSYVLFLDDTGKVLSHQKISDTAGNFTAPLDNEDDFGASLAALGDLDGTGPTNRTLAIGAAADDDGGTNRGAVYVLFLETGPLVDVVEGPSVRRDLLGYARPNPSGPTTTIPFRIGDPASVRIEIFDIHGRLVRTLVEGSYFPGEHQAVWNGVGDSGRRLPSGTYFYRMSTNGRSVVGSRKMVLLE